MRPCVQGEGQGAKLHRDIGARSQRPGDALLGV
jgi:hypothetical protein